MAGDVTAEILYTRDYAVALAALGAPAAELRRLIIRAIDVLERGAKMPEFQHDGGAAALQGWADAIRGVCGELECIERIAASSDEMSRDAALALATPPGVSLN
jgi:hypothetical protein